MRYRRYTREFKEDACKLAADPEVGPTRAAKRLGMPAATLRLWMQARGLIEERPVVEPLESDDPAVLKRQVRDLRERIRQLEIDQDILKKAAAYFAREKP